LPHQCGDQRQGNAPAATNTATATSVAAAAASTTDVESPDTETTDTTAPSANDTMEDLQHILHLMSVKHHDRTIGLMSTCHLDYLDWLAYPQPWPFSLNGLIHLC
jgi:hypothetical protein